jgi:hypothetical protein
MIQFNGREYWSLQETAKWLDLSQSTTLKHLRREALLRFKGQGIKKAALHEDGDFDLDKIRWIDGLFWLPIDAYLELNELLSGDIKSITFSELEPQIIKIKDRLDCGTQRCDPAMGIWLPIDYPELTEIRLLNLDDLYFWEETVNDFARREEIHIPLADNMLPLDVIAKKLNKSDSERDSSQEKLFTSKLELRMNELVSIVHQFGLEPLNLPPEERGKTGLRSKVKKIALENPGLFTEDTFKKAWDRCFADKLLIRLPSASRGKNIP